MQEKKSNCKFIFSGLFYIQPSQKTVPITEKEEENVENKENEKKEEEKVEEELHDEGIDEELDEDDL